MHECTSIKAQIIDEFGANSADMSSNHWHEWILPKVFMHVLNMICVEFEITILRLSA